MTIEDIKLNDSERTPCSVWVRVMGYLRPVESFNNGKKSEYYERVCFKEEKAVAHMNSQEMLDNSLAAE